jgi:predicted GIY-YIG superfamily endonuclease
MWYTVAQLQKMTSYLGSPRDVPEMRNKMHEIQEQTRSLVRETNDAIKRLGAFDGGSAAESRERRMQQVGRSRRCSLVQCTGVEPEHHR